MTDVHYWSATETLAKFAAREVSPVEVLDAVADRIATVNPRVNALSEQMIDEAYEAARQSENRYQRGRPVGPLDGLLIAAKDEHDIAGRAATSGSLILEGATASDTHPVVARLLAAGGIVHARTTTPEFSLVPFTHSKLWGITRNPWNLDFTPGGSSGGSGAALASGIAHLATGSDIGGSIRIPASFCGVVGFKPPFGRIPARPPFNQEPYCTDGPLGRTVADVAMFQNVLAGPDPSDNNSLRPKYVIDDLTTGVAGLRIALSVGLGDYEVDAAVERNIRQAARLLQEAGATVEEVALPWTADEIVRIAGAHLGGLASEALAEIPEEQRELLMPYTRDFGSSTGAAAASMGISELMLAENSVYRPLGALLENFDALIAPTWAGQGLPAGDDLIDAPIAVNGSFTDWRHQIMTLAFNIVSRVPVLNVPTGLAPNGVPTGAQIVGRTYDDHTVFRVGAALEAAQGLWHADTWRPNEHALSSFEPLNTV